MNKLTCAAVAAVLSCLTGCASTQTVLSKEPTHIYHSDKPMSDVVFCLQNKNDVPALEQSDGSKVVLIKNGYGGVAIAISVYPDGSGTRTEVRNQFGIIGAAWKQCIGTELPPVGA